MPEPSSRRPPASQAQRGGTGRRQNGVQVFRALGFRIESAGWEAREAYTTTYHPLRALAEHPARAGRFSAVVLRAAQTGAVSWDTAAEWLFTPEDEIRRRAPAIVELYPDLFQLGDSIAFTAEGTSP